MGEIEASYNRLHSKKQEINYSLILVGVISVALVFCSVLFDLSYKMIRRNLSQVSESELGGTLSWEHMYFEFQKGLVIENLRMYKSIEVEDYNDVLTSENNNIIASEESSILLNKRIVLYAKHIEFKLDLNKILKYSFENYETLSDYDRERISKVMGVKKIPLSVKILKSIDLLHIKGLDGDINTIQDKHLFDFISNSLFTKKILPENADLKFNDINISVIIPMITPIVVNTENLNLDLNLNAAKGIALSYVGNVKVNNVKQRLNFLNISGEANSKDFMQNIQLTSRINAIGLNDLYISPLQIEFHKSLGNFAFNVDFEKSNININASYIDSVLDIDFLSEDANISDILARPYKSFETIYNEQLNGKGKFVKNFGTRFSEYYLNLATSARSENQINIDLNGNEDLINVSTLIINLENQYIFANGDISLLTYGANGNLKFSIGEPLFSNTISGSFEFENTPYSSIGIGQDLEINGIHQRDIEIEYSTLNKFLNINFVNTNTNILEIDKLGDNTLRLSFTSFPFSFLSPFLNFEKMPYFYDAEIDSVFKINYKEEAISNIIYKIKVSYKDKTNDFIDISGLVLGKKIYINASNFKFDKLGIIGNAKGYVYSSFYDEQEIPIYLDLNIKRDNISNNLVLKMEYKKNNYYNISLDKNFSIDMLFENTLRNNISTLSQLNINSNKFHIPLTNYYFESDSIFSFKSSQLDNFNTNILVRELDKNSDVFILKSQYDNDKGSINEFKLQLHEYYISAIGSLSYDEASKLININIVEVPENELVISDLVDTISTQSIDVSYGLNNKNLNLKANNLKIGAYFKNLDGLINFDMLIDMKQNKYFGYFYDSIILSKTNKYNFEAEFDVSNIEDLINFDINNLRISDDNSKLEFSTLKLRNSTHLDGQFEYSTFDGSDIYEVYKGSLNITSEYLNISSSDEHTNFIDTILKSVGRVDGNLVLEPQFAKSPSMYNRYFYNLRLKHLDGVLSIYDPQKEVSIQINNNDETILAYLGNKKSIFSSDIRGSYNPENMNVQFNLNRFDYGLFRTEFLNRNRGIEYNTLVMSGELSLRGKVIDPRVYGYLNIESLEAYFPFFDKDISFHEMNILISDNEMSLVNAYLTLNKQKIFLNAQGRLNGLVPEEISVEFFTQKNSLIQVKKLRIGSLQVVGKFSGNVNMNIIENSIDIDGTIQFEDALISNERFSVRQQIYVDRNKTERAKNKNSLNVNIVTKTLDGVVFAWPSSSFPVLRAGFDEDQEIDVSFDSEVRELSILSNMNFNSGVIYYFDRAFNIEQLNIKIDEYNKLNDPFIVSLKANDTFRYENENYELILSADSTTLKDMRVAIDSKPFLSVSELSNIFGRSIVPDTQENLANSTQQSLDNSVTTNLGAVSSFIKISDPITNIGIFSRLEISLQRSLKLDFISFKTKVFENLLTYTLNNNDENIYDTTSTFRRINNMSLLPYLFSNTAIEFGKYIDKIYFNLSLELNTENILGDNNINYFSNNLSDFVIPIKTSLNVEIPTPIFDLTWTGALQPYYYNKLTLIPVNLLTISWERKY